MSQRQSKGKSRASSTDANASLSQPGPSGEKKSFEQREWEALDLREKKLKINEITRFLLFASSKGIPVKRDDVIKAVMPGKRSFNLALAEANEKLEKEFGLSVIESKKGTQKILILVNALPSDTRDKLVKHSEESLSFYGLLTVILSFLLMRPNQRANEEQLWNLLLNPLGINEDSSNHPMFGNTKGVVDAFVEQCYLEKEKTVVGEMTMWEYKWGPRAHAEVDKKELLLIMSEVHGDQFSLWERQFGDLVEDK